MSEAPGYSRHQQEYDNARCARGVIFLPTETAIALWKGEIQGQMSDGAWENSNPRNHWVF